MTYDFLISSLMKEFPNGERGEWAVTDSNSMQIMFPIRDEHHVCVGFRFMQILEESDIGGVGLHDRTYFIKDYTTDELWEEGGQFYYESREEFTEQPLYVKFECLFEEDFVPEVIDTAENIHKEYLKRVNSL